MNDSSCSQSNASSTDGQLLFEFVAYGVLLNLIGIFGIVGNIISMIILSRPQMRSSINYLLIGLARCDTVLIVTSVLLFGLPAIYGYTGMLMAYFYYVYPLVAPIVFPVALIAQTVSVYLTLTVTLERFVAVCHPLQARSLCTYGRARLYVLLILALATVYNLPRFWEVTHVEDFSPITNSTIYTVAPTSLRDNRIYISVYIHWLYFIFLYILPFACLAVLNTAIYRQVRKANQERQRLSRLQKKEIGLATMLLCVVIVFFLCNILALVNNILEAFYCINIDQLVKTSNLLITINSSVNFVIYVIFGEKFKRLFLKMFCSHGRWLGHGGRDSPDGTHDDSLVSNGDGRHYSIRLQRSVTRHASRRQGPRAPSPGPCVYYPKRTHEWDATTSTTVNKL
ncbi:FMRFamide receptor [Schistocerca americana]|uniref:FMRFamide receptor n=1 Tax=Schistocerca americana TaxID=7009 RepID=UPI001F50366F|nr:FMRFamide receptor [Schistocerca americana]XP_047103496.1 FMRFamide receptor [Schistocerca piceifrons]XP_049847116.1 FMRFamide receptor [Schistocerca gregaria]XP_049847117.1 FMRFamide receptor [Schistocerca gregaria]XP_049955813.1 FMRFamide receptor [Schistocerca serialis cubense]